jgi:hypothetical protein
MKRNWILAIAAVLTQAALGEGSAPDPKALGITEAVVSYCVKVEPSSAPQFQERVKGVAQGATEDQLAKVRLTDEYEKAHASVDDFVAKVDERNSKAFCTRQMAQKK